MTGDNESVIEPHADPLASTPQIAACAEASARNGTLFEPVQRAGTGSDQGQRGLGRRTSSRRRRPPVPLCVRTDDGFTLHAQTRIPRHDREALERLCRYVLRPLIPRPHANLVRYHGVLAPAAAWRPEIVAQAVAPKPKSERQQAEVDDAEPASRPFRRIPWADLLERTLRAAGAAARARSGALIDDEAVARQFLAHLGLPHELPRPAPARGPPEPELSFTDAA